MPRAAIWLVLLVAAVYANSLGGGPVVDDPRLMVTNTQVVTAGVWQAFTTNFWEASAKDWQDMAYRPLTKLVFSAIYGVFGLTPFAFHAASILCHAAATLAVLFLAGGLGLSERAAALAAALFAVHPLNVEAVAWMSGMSEPLSGACVLGSLALFLYGRRWPSLGLAVVAVFSKEIALALPALVFLLAREKRWRAALPYAAVAVCYVAAAAAVLPAPPKGTFARSGVLTAMTGSAAHYLRVLFAPWPLAVHYPPPGAAGLAIGALIAVAWIALAWRLRDTAMPAAACLGALPLLIPIVHSPMMESIHQSPDRNVYLAVAGASLTVALLLDRLPARAMFVAGWLLLSLAMIGTVRQVGFWRNDETLWSHALDVTPSSKRAALVLGNVYALEGRFAEEERVYRKALVYHPDDSELLDLLSLAREHQLH